MADYLSNLVDKSLGQAPVVEPRPTPRFAPSPYLDGALADPDLTPVPASVVPEEATPHLSEASWAQAMIEPPSSMVTLPPPPDPSSTPAPARRRAPRAPALPAQAALDEADALFEQRPDLATVTTAHPLHQESPPAEQPDQPTQPRTPRSERSTFSPAAPPTKTSVATPVDSPSPAHQSALLPLVEQRLQVEASPATGIAMLSRNAQATRLGNDQSRPGQPLAAAQRQLGNDSTPTDELEVAALQQSNAARLATIRMPSATPVNDIAGRSLARESNTELALPARSNGTDSQRLLSRQTAQEPLTPYPSVGERGSSHTAMPANRVSALPAQVDHASHPLDAAQQLAPLMTQPVRTGMAARSSSLASQNLPEAPTIQVTIGRVEVRATPPPAATAPRRAERAPVMSLDDYLRSRRGEAERGGKNPGETSR